MAATIIEDLEETRERRLALVAPVADDDLERVHSELMSPLVWDLGHIAAFEDLWICHRHGGRPLLREDLAEVYDAFETPRSGRGALPYLRTEESYEYLAELRERSLEVIADRGVGDGVIPELIVRHEQQHTETMLQTLQLAQLSGYQFEQRTLETVGATRSPASSWRRSRRATVRSAQRLRGSRTTTSDRDTELSWAAT